jgi:hypothetical protein
LEQVAGLILLFRSIFSSEAMQLCSAKELYFGFLAFVYNVFVGFGEESVCAEQGTLDHGPGVGSHDDRNQDLQLHPLYAQ